MNTAISMEVVTRCRKSTNVNVILTTMPHHGIFLVHFNETYQNTGSSMVHLVADSKNICEPYISDTTQYCIFHGKMRIICVRKNGVR